MTSEMIELLPGKRLAILNGKGGVAKTTSAVALATAAVRRGYKVNAIDADDQGSLTSWWSEAQKSSPEPLGWTTRSMNTYELEMLAGTPVEPGTLEIIDCPPKEPQVLNLAAAAADFIIVPTSPSNEEVKQVWKVLKAVGSIPTAVLIVKAKLRTNNFKRVTEAFDEAKVPYFTNVIVDREDIRSWGGTVPTRLFGYDDVLVELEEAMK